MDHPTPPEAGFLVAAHEYQQGSWRGGSLRTIYQHPAGATATGDYDIWVNLATIEQVADYSYLPGYTRVHLPIAGNGLRLHFQMPVAELTLPTGQAIQFDGARPLHVIPLAGTVTAFNLIFRNALEGNAQVVEVGEDPSTVARPPASAGEWWMRVIYNLTDRLTIQLGTETLAVLQAGDSYIFPPEVNNRSTASTVLSACNSTAQAVVADLRIR